MSYQRIGESINLKEIKKLSKLSEGSLLQKFTRDQQLAKILSGSDARLLMVMGPCSAHDEEAVVEYGRRLAKLQKEVEEKIFFVMRVYTNKPRTIGDGYKGMLHSSASTPEEVNIFQGVKKVRKLHSRIVSECGLTTADELLYPESYQIFDDLVSYLAVGARSVEDQQHRFIASMVNQPIGLKNPTSGNLRVLFNALHVAQKPQRFLFHYDEVQTSGNALSHAILRGGQDEFGQHTPNYNKVSLLKAIAYYKNEAFQTPAVLVDTNHDNSGKQYLLQPEIIKDVLDSRRSDKEIAKFVRGFMIESFLEDGSDPSGKVFGKSVTDPCLGWEKTELMIREVYNLL